MKTPTVIILRHFLQSLEQRCEIEKLQEPIAPAFIHLLNRRELIAILAMVFGNTDNVKEKYPDYETASDEELLFAYIRDEYYILQYFRDIVLKQYIL